MSGPGVVRPLARRLSAAPDPLALYAAGSDRGRRPHTFLLESADATTALGRQSIVGVRAALHLRAERNDVAVTALTANGDAALAWLERGAPRLGSDGPAGGAPEHQPWSGTRTGRTVTFRLPRRDGPCLDEEQRFREHSPLDLLRTLQQRPRLAARPNAWCHLLAGTLSYDLVDCFESLPEGAPDPLEQPLLEWWLADRLLVIDHARRQTHAIATAWGGPGHENRYHDAGRDLERLVAAATSGDSAEASALLGAVSEAGPADPPEPLESPGWDANGDGVGTDLSDQEFAALVGRLKDHILAGDCYQIVPSRTFSLPCPDPLAAYARLRERNPSPYQFYFVGSGATLFGASPETCLRVDGESRRACIAPVAGTAARGLDDEGRLDPDQDTRNEVALRLDQKEAAEHLMLVDLARNDLARISRPGTRAVTRLLAVERFSRVMHLVSEVTGELAPGVDALEAYAATLNMGTLVGAPKVRAAEILRQYEPARRGAYGGAVGYLCDDDTLVTAIVIRSAVVRHGLAHVRAGAGVVLDSDPAAEALETRRKASAVLDALRDTGAPTHA